MREPLKQIFLEKTAQFQIGESFYLALKEVIVSNQLAPNTRLKEEEISKDLGISRTPVRDALLLLEQSGLICSDAKKGYIIKQFSIKECIDIISYVRILRRSAAGITAAKITESELYFLRNTTYSRYAYKRHQQFHLKIAALTDNALLLSESQKTHEKLMMIYNCYTKKMQQNFPKQSYSEEHRLLLEAFKRRDSEQAEAIVDQYAKNMNLVVRRMYALNFEFSIHQVSRNTMDFDY